MKLLKLLSICCFLSLVACTADQDFGGRSEAAEATSNTVNGSYTNMLTVDDRLYALTVESISTFDITNKANPKLINKQNVGFSIESIYHVEGVLFIGSREALHIFSLDSDGVPVRQSETEYDTFGDDVTPCDPVVAKNDIAYVTLSATESGPCQTVRPINQLRTYNVANLQNPQLLSVTDMIEPKGLGLDGQYLFVAEANNGVVVYDVSNPASPSVVSTLDGFRAYDLIPNDGILLVVGPSKITQFDYTDIENIRELSSINL